jgi:hypothetical protein
MMAKIMPIISIVLKLSLKTKTPIMAKIKIEKIL